MRLGKMTELLRLWFPRGVFPCQILCTHKVNLTYLIFCFKLDNLLSSRMASGSAVILGAVCYLHGVCGCVRRGHMWLCPGVLHCLGLRGTGHRLAVCSASVDSWGALLFFFLDSPLAFVILTFSDVSLKFGSSFVLGKYMWWNFPPQLSQVP